uniref:Uncharacterized protein pph87 n=1 Tax=Pseudomonas savastanoi pv. phaseolicola TaxID=319 RepID=Q4LBH0_PSESH|nr:hypothetical protein [Pseudomonas savastanoi pv. phaseolicola]
MYFKFHYRPPLIAHQHKAALGRYSDIPTPVSALSACPEFIPNIPSFFHVATQRARIQRTPSSEHTPRAEQKYLPRCKPHLQCAAPLPPDLLRPKSRLIEPLLIS